MYAIIATGGKQYKVSEGDTIKVEKLNVEAGDTVKFDEVLAIGGDKLLVGDDVKSASVSATVVENGKAKRSSFTVIRERAVITRRTDTDKHTLRLRSIRSRLKIGQVVI